MGTPEIARSGKTDLDPDHAETGLQGQKRPASRGETGPVPTDNEPGHHPAKEQDQPDLDAFAAKLGTNPDAPKATAARKGPAKTAPAKATPSQASRPAASVPKEQPAPAKRPVTVLGPSAEEAAHVSAPQPEPEDDRESRLTTLVLLPLRETVKRLEQLDRTLTRRLESRRRSA